jgi:hypothetical protein
MKETNYQHIFKLIYLLLYFIANRSKSTTDDLDTLSIFLILTIPEGCNTLNVQ